MPMKTRMSVLTMCNGIRQTRTVKWTAVTGDIGAALTLDYDNKHNDFDDNNAILDTGLRNYANM